jgi:hypothetical protein
MFSTTLAILSSALNAAKTMTMTAFWKSQRKMEWQKAKTSQEADQFFNSIS